MRVFQSGGKGGVCVAVDGFGGQNNDLKVPGAGASGKRDHSLRAFGHLEAMTSQGPCGGSGDLRRGPV